MSEITDHEVALAKVGLIALIDEATGFQQEREKDALFRMAERVGVSVGAVLVLIDRAMEIAGRAAAGENTE